MFNGVKGEGIKKYFQGRRGRTLSFASNEPVKIQTGVDIKEIAQGAVDKNTDNLIIASLKATIEDLRIQLSVKKDVNLQAKLNWAIEYLSKFEKEIEIIRKKQPTPKPQRKSNTKEHELKTILSNIKMQTERVLKKLRKLPFVLVKDDFEVTKAEISNINEQVLLYEQSIAAYISKGGIEECPKIEFTKLKVIYKLVAKKIEEFKDELKESSEEKYEIKQNITLLEKFADDLVKFATSPEIYAAIRTEVDREIAQNAPVKKIPETHPPEPSKPSYQEAVESYEREIDTRNAIVDEINNCIARVEELNNNPELTFNDIEEYIKLEEKIKDGQSKIALITNKLAAIRKEGKELHKIDIAKLTCIQNKKIEKIQYKMKFKTFIEALDKKAILVIERIKELELSKTNAPKENAEIINKEIEMLYNFLLAINSLIEKRIVQESKEKHKSITELYKERFTIKKALDAENKIDNIEITSQQSEAKTDLESFEKRIIELCEKWLKAIKLAPIDRKRNILIDETIYAEEMSVLIANSHDEAKLRAIITASENFNKSREQLIKEKRLMLNKFREKVTSRIRYIFQTGTIEETVKKGIDYNEWLTEIEYIELLHLANEPEFKALIPNTEDLVKEFIAEQEVKYKGIKKRQQSETIKKLSNEFVELVSKVEKIEIDENFEQSVIAIFEEMKINYKVLKDFDCKIDFEQNIVTIYYMANKYEFNSGAYKIVPQEFAHVIMSQKKYKQYRLTKGLDSKETKTKQESESSFNPAAEIKFVNNNELEPSNIKVTNRTLQLATTRRQVINRAKNLMIKNTDSLTVSLIKQGLRIKYNENLRNQLKALNAKISLVNKSNYRSRKDMKFTGDETEQDLAFKTKKENFNIEDYKLEVRLVEEEKKRSDLLYSFDLENISDELHGRSK